MLELLPKDLIVIISRYVFDYQYSLVRHEYERVWLNCYLNSEYNIFWDIYYNEFCTMDRYVANYRALTLNPILFPIRKFYDTLTVGEIHLPINY